MISQYIVIQQNKEKLQQQRLQHARSLRKDLLSGFDLDESNSLNSDLFSSDSKESAGNDNRHRPNSSSSGSSDDNKQRKRKNTESDHNYNAYNTNVIKSSDHNNSIQRNYHHSQMSHQQQQPVHQSMQKPKKRKNKNHNRVGRMKSKQMSDYLQFDPNNRGGLVGASKETHRSDNSKGSQQQQAHHLKGLRQQLTKGDHALGSASERSSNNEKASIKQVKRRPSSTNAQRAKKSGEDPNKNQIGVIGVGSPTSNHLRQQSQSPIKLAKDKKSNSHSDLRNSKQGAAPHNNQTQPKSKFSTTSNQHQSQQQFNRKLTSNIRLSSEQDLQSDHIPVDQSPGGGNNNISLSPHYRQNKAGGMQQLGENLKLRQQKSQRMQSSALQQQDSSPGTGTKFLWNAEDDPATPSPNKRGNQTMLKNQNHSGLTVNRMSSMGGVGTQQHSDHLAKKQQSFFGEISAHNESQLPPQMSHQSSLKQKNNFLSPDGGANNNAALSSDNNKQEQQDDLKVLFKVGNIEFTRRYINFLNKVYAAGKQKKSILEAMHLYSMNSPNDLQISQNIEGGPQLLIIEDEKIPIKRSCCDVIKRKILCQQGDTDDDENWSVIHTPPYTSGESDDDEIAKSKYFHLSEDSKKARMTELWRKLKVKLIAGARIVDRFAELSEKITMFGASRGIAVDFEDEMIPLPIIMMPESRVRMAWNMVTLILLVYTATFVPYRTAFIEEVSPALEVWEWIVDTLFLIDIIVNFLSAYENTDKNIEVRLKYIARTYITSWFFFDLAAVFPFQLLNQTTEAQIYAQENSYLQDLNNSTLVVDSGGSSKRSGGQNINKLIRLARLPRLYRLVRILRLFKIFSLISNNLQLNGRENLQFQRSRSRKITWYQWFLVQLVSFNHSLKKMIEKINMNVGVQRMLIIAFAVVFMVHLMACLFFLVSKFEDEDSSSNWVVYAGIQDEQNSYQYLVSVYWALQTLTTVGYGDILTRSVYEKIAALIWMIIGVGFYSFTIGNLASIFNQIDVKAAHLQQKLAVLAEFSKRTRLSEEVQNKVKRFLENNHIDHLNLSDQKQLLSEVPASMRAEVVSFTHSAIIKQIKFFNEKDPPFLFTILPLLKPMKVYPKDTLYCMSDYAEEVFFIFQGRVKMYIEFTDPDNNFNNSNNLTNPNFINDGKTELIPFNLYVEGSYFGDSDIFISEQRNVRDCTAISCVQSQLLVITRKELNEVLKKYKKIKTEMKEVGLERKKHHERQIQIALERHQQKIEKAKKESQVVQNTTEEGDKSIAYNLKQKLMQVRESMRNSQTSDFLSVEEQELRARNQLMKLKQKALKVNTKAEVFNLLSTFKNPKNNKFATGITPPRILYNNDKQNKISMDASPINNSRTPPLMPYNSGKVEEYKIKEQVIAPKSHQSFNNTNQESFKLQSKEEHLINKQGGGSAHHTAPGTNKSSAVDLHVRGPSQAVIGVNKKSQSTKTLHYGFRQDDLKASGPSSMHSGGGGESAPVRKFKKGGGNSTSTFAKGRQSSRNNMFIREHSQDGDTSTTGRQQQKLRKKVMDFDDLDMALVDGEDFQWDQNEEVFASFQENMALIAGNSFEILKLYEMIKTDYEKVTNKIDKAQEHMTTLDSRTQELEGKLGKLLNIL